MSTYSAAAYDPETDTVRTARWLDNYFGHHLYGVQFDEGGPVYRPEDVEIPLDGVFVRTMTGAISPEER